MTKFYRSTLRNLGVLSLVVMFGLSGYSALSQDRICLSYEHEMKMRAKYPQLGTKEQFEERFNSLVKSVQSRKSGPAEVLTIPIIIHIIHDGEAVGVGDNLSADLAYAQIDQLNADFRRTQGTSGYNENPVGTDTYIEFAPALIDPSGDILGEPGINRINRNDMGWNAPPYDGIGSDYIDVTIKADSYWDPDLYFNFWAMDLSGGLLGYAQFPSLSGLAGMPEDGGPASTDGVVVLTSSMGSSAMPNPNGPGSFNEGRTATHEVGHWLGLRHIWGDGGCGVDDFVEDTPEQGFSSSGCPTDQSSCGFDDMVENYMDYSDDYCMNVFTIGQKARMDAVLATSPRRASLLNSTVHLAPFPNLIISEVMDGAESGGVPKYIELHNAGVETYDLSTVTIRVFANGATDTFNEVAITGGTMLESGASYVIAGAAFQTEWGGVFTTAVADQTSGSISGNGDDVYEIFDTDTQLTIDRYGELGIDGTSQDWEYTDGNVTRKSYVLKVNNGNFDFTDWEYVPYSNETATPGTHTAETPAFDPILLGIEGIDDGETYFACDGFIGFEPYAVIENAGAQAITSVDLSIYNSYESNPNRGISGIFTAVFEPALQPGEIGSVQVDDFTVSVDGEYYFEIEIVDAADGNPTNNEIARADYEVNIFQDAYDLAIETQTDDYPDETVWSITNTEGTVIYENAVLFASTLNIDEVCLEEGDYIFTLTDTYGDGISNGYSSLYVGETLIVSIPGDHPDFDVFFGPDERSVSFEFSLPFESYTDLSVDITSPESGDLSSCFNEVGLEATVTNSGTTVVNGFEISFGIEGDITSEIIDGLFIMPGEAINLNLGLVSMVSGSNTIGVSVDAVSDTSGGGDDNFANNLDDVTINFSESDENGLKLSLFTDSFPEETSWELLDGSGAEIASSGELTEASEIVELFCLPDGDYIFNLFDSFGDGIFNDIAVVLEDGEGQEIAILSGEFDASTSAEFSLPFVPFTDAAIDIIDPLEGALIASCSPSTPISIAVTNTGSTVITDITLALGSDEYVFEDILFPAGESAVFVLGNVDLTVGANSVSASITSVNGADQDDDTSNNSSTVNVTFEEDESLSAVEINLHLDNYPNETSWAVIDAGGNVLADGGDYSEGETTVSEILCLPEACFDFVLHDDWGDGGPGVDVIVDGNTELTIEGGNWGTETSGVFCVGDALRPVASFEAVASGAFAIDLSWEYDYDEDGFVILRSFTGENGSYTYLTDVESADRTYTDNNALSEETRYYYAIRAKRGDDFSASVFTDGSTGSNLGVTELYEGFEGETFPPEGWFSIDADEDGEDWFIGESPTRTAQNGEKSAVSASWIDGTILFPDNYLITPEINIEADYTLVYWVAAQDPAYAAEKYQVLVSTAGTNTADFTAELSTETLASDEWSKREFDLSSYAGQAIRIAWRHFDVSDQFEMKIDEVFVGLPGDDEPEGVAAPTDLTASAASAYQIDLTWAHDDADEFIVLRSLTDELGSFEVVEIVPSAASPTYSDQGLMPETTYYYEVRAKKGEDISVGATAYATTNAEDLGDFKLEESFEGETFPPDGWYSVDVDLDGQDWFVGESPTRTAQDGEKSAVSASWIDGTILFPDNYLVTPEVTVEAGDFLVYWVAAQDPSYAAEKYQVLLSTAGTNTSDFTIELTTETLNSADWSKREFDLTSYVGQTIRIAWRHFDVSDQFEMKIDNVKVGDPSAGETPPAAPSGLVATAMGSSQIDLTWTDNSENEDDFELQSADSELGPWIDDTSVSSGVTSHSATGLDEATTVHYRLRASNSVGVSEWTLSSSATTELNAPSNLSVAANGTTQLDLTWTDNSNAEEGFEVESSSDGSNWTVLESSVAADATSFSHTGLNQGMEMHYRVKATSTLVDSDWSSSASASTSVLGITQLGEVSIKFYPNPVLSNLIIELDRSSVVSVSVFDYSGKQQQVALNVSDKSIFVDMSELSSGLYFINLTDGTNELNWRILKN